MRWSLVAGMAIDDVGPASRRLKRARLKTRAARLNVNEKVTFVAFAKLE